MDYTEKWELVRARLTEAERRRNYELCALLSLELAEPIDEVTPAWLGRAQVYATLSVLRQLQLQSESTLR